MTVTRSLPGPYNTYVPTAKASGNLFVDYSRNINDFAVLKYCQPVSVYNTLGIWYQMGLDERARIMDSNGARYRWADDAPRPEANDVSEYFQELQFRTKRYSYSDHVGKMTSEQAVWDEIDRRTRSLAQKAMTFRTQAVLNVMTNSSLYPSSHVADLSQANAISGVTGNWAASTAARQSIKRTLNYIKQLIVLDTRAALKANDLVMVMSPITAELLSVTQEIVEMVKFNMQARAYMRANEEFPKEMYGLPPQLYGTDVIIEETVEVTTPRGASTQTAQFVMPTGTVLVCHRPGSIEGVEGGRSFSTATIHIYRDDDMKVETDYVSWDRRTKLAVTDNFDVNLTAPVSGFLLLNVC